MHAPPAEQAQCRSGRRNGHDQRAAGPLADAPRARPSTNRRRVMDCRGVRRVIPVTPIMRRYQRLRKCPQEERLAEAHLLLRDPTELAQEFASSVTHFLSYWNVEDH